jgi:hypothetical protein
MMTFRFCSIAGLLLWVGVSFGQEVPAAFLANFEKEKLGELPDGMMEIEGLFTVAADGEKNKALKMSEDPLAENAVIMGPSFEGAGSVSVRVRAEKKRRSFPRFGIGVHGISGYRLRVVGASNLVELVKGEEVVQSVPFKWDAAVWNVLKLEVLQAGEKWIVSGWVWPEGTEQPEVATIALESDDKPGRGKASLWGTPYAGKPVWFDDVKILPGAAK